MTQSSPPRAVNVGLFDGPAQASQALRDEVLLRHGARRIARQGTDQAGPAANVLPPNNVA